MLDKLLSVKGAIAACLLGAFILALLNKGSAAGVAAFLAAIFFMFGMAAEGF
jgi:roadblock/LC7 domain-containing protein